MKNVFKLLTAGLLLGGLLPGGDALAEATEGAPDRIFYNGRVVTVDEAFSVQEAIAIRGARIQAVGGDDELLRMAGPETERVDLDGRMVLPGLMDSHTHASGASVFEFDHPVPTMRSVEDVLKYVRGRAALLPAGEPIHVSQVFITRLADQRFPTRQELDDAAPEHPVYFRTGPDAALNSLALAENGIDRNYQPDPEKAGKVEFDPETGEPNGIIRSAGEHVRMPASKKATPSFDERCQAMKRLLADYNRVGITSISERRVSSSTVKIYDKLRDDGELTCRAFLCWGVNPNDSLDAIRKSIETAANHPDHQYNDQVWLRGVKVFLDGGMLTGSAYMREPWGVSEIYSIDDPKYRGVRFIDEYRLYEIARLSLENGLQFTAHAVGDGATEALVETYRRINENDFSVRPHRPCVTHCNFLTSETIEMMQQLGVVADMQPAWLWLDGRTLQRQFGEQRLQFFQPYKTLFETGVVVGGGSDHMQKIGDLRGLNPYNPFLGMWITLARVPRGLNSPLHPKEALSREEALRLYTTNNAFLMFDEANRGSLEANKLADFIVIDRDYLQCPLEEVKEIRVEATWLGGKQVYSQQTR